MNNEVEKKKEMQNETADRVQCLVGHECGDLSEKSIDELMRVLDECFNGAREWGAFLDGEEDGLFPMLRAMNGEEASEPTAGISVANHVHHVIFGIDVFTKRLAGDENAFNVDWGASWEERPLSDAEWKAMQTRLSGQWEKLKPLVREQAAENFWMMLGLLTHTVFHLGTIRVKFDVLKARA